jgi:hypothetical protein
MRGWAGRRCRPAGERRQRTWRARAKLTPRGRGSAKARRRQRARVAGTGSQARWCAERRRTRGRPNTAGATSRRRRRLAAERQRSGQTETHAKHSVQATRVANRQRGDGALGDVLDAATAPEPLNASDTLRPTFELTCLRQTAKRADAGQVERRVGPSHQRRYGRRELKAWLEAKAPPRKANGGSAVPKRTVRCAKRAGRPCRESVASKTARFAANREGGAASAREAWPRARNRSCFARGPRPHAQ